MAAIDYLPTEILLQACANLPIIDLLHISSCSRRHHSIAQNLLYQNICLPSSRQLCCFARTILSTPRLARTIRSLNFLIYPDDTLGEKEIRTPIWEQAFLKGSRELENIFPDIGPYLEIHRREHKTWAGMVLLLASNLSYLMVTALQRNAADTSVYNSGAWWRFGDRDMDNQIDFLARSKKLELLSSFGFQTAPILELSLLTTLVVNLDPKTVRGSVAKMCYGLNNLRSLGLHIEKDTRNIRSFCRDLSGLETLQSLQIFSCHPNAFPPGQPFHMPIHNLTQLREVSGPRIILGAWTSFPKTIRVVRVWNVTSVRGVGLLLSLLTRWRTSHPELQSINIHCDAINLVELGRRYCEWSHTHKKEAQVAVNFYRPSLAYLCDGNNTEWTGTNLYQVAVNNYQLPRQTVRKLFNYTMDILAKSDCDSPIVCHCLNGQRWLPTQHITAHFTNLPFDERVSKWLNMFFKQDNDGHEHMARLVLPYLAAFPEDFDFREFTTIAKSIFSTCEFDSHHGLIRAIRAQPFSFIS